MAQGIQWLYIQETTRICHLKELYVFWHWPLSPIRRDTAPTLPYFGLGSVTASHHLRHLSQGRGTVSSIPIASRILGVLGAEQCHRRN